MQALTVTSVRQYILRAFRSRRSARCKDSVQTYGGSPKTSEEGIDAATSALFGTFLAFSSVDASTTKSSKTGQAPQAVLPATSGRLDLGNELGGATSQPISAAGLPRRTARTRPGRCAPFRPQFGRSESAPILCHKRYPGALVSPRAPGGPLSCPEAGVQLQEKRLRP